VFETRASVQAVYKEYSSGARTLPCGTVALIGYIEEKLFLTVIINSRPFRYDFKIQK